MFPLRSVVRTVPILKRGIATSAPKLGGGAWAYRVAPQAPSKVTVLKAEVVGTVMWWWVLYHLFTEPEHITGEFPYPDPAKWTDAELGIPPDDED